MKTTFFLNRLLLLICTIGLFCSCDDDDDKEVKALFTSSISIENNQAILSLTNLSVNADSYEWTFSGATTESSTEENPIVRFNQNGSYQISLTASSEEGTDTLSVEIEINGISNSSDEGEDDTNQSNVIVGSGKIITKTLNFSDFNSINQTSSLQLSIAYAEEFSVSATGYENLFDYLDFKVENEQLIIKMKNRSYQNLNLEVTIQMPSLLSSLNAGSGNMTFSSDFPNEEISIETSGSGNQSFTSELTAENVSISLSGSGNITFEQNLTLTNTLNSTSSSSGTIDLKGSASNHVVKLSGSGDVNGYYTSDSAEVTSSASGSCELTVNNSLNVTIKGSGDVSYKATPTITKQITGTGQLINAN